MKILWFTNIPLPEMLGTDNRSHSGSGSWIVALLEELEKIPTVEIYIASASPGLSDEVEIKGIGRKYYPIRQGPVWRLFGFRNLDNKKCYLHQCVQIVREVAPDIIHIHGTERFYGLLGVHEMVSAPIVISLQGLIHEISKYRYYFGVTPLTEVILLHDFIHLLRGMGPFFDYFSMRRSIKRELKILKKNFWFTGQTTWDMAHLYTVNHSARYFQIHRILRPVFYKKQWDIELCQRHRIIFTNANYFYRGTEVLLEAIAILKSDFPNINLALAGGVEKLPYGKTLERRISALGLKGTVEYLGQLNEEKMSVEICKSHLFAIASLIENESNSLCEAQLVGLPCVVSYAGGMPSMVEEGRSGLFFPPGDAAVLAARIKEIFLDDDLAIRLGAEARKTALIRHDPEIITQKVLEVYRQVIAASVNKQNSNAEIIIGNKYSSLNKPYFVEDGNEAKIQI